MSLTEIPGFSVFSFDGELQKGTFKCNLCPKLFKRSEHRSRHERSHTNEKPYSCRFCPRFYHRSDLLLRHEKTVHAGRSQLRRSYSNSISRSERSGYSNSTMNIMSKSNLEPAKEDEIAANGLTTPPASYASNGSETQAINGSINAMDYSQDGGVQQASLPFASIGDSASSRDESDVSSAYPFADMSLNFFDPFLESTFDQFALPRINTHEQSFSPPGDSAWNSYSPLQMSNSACVNLLAQTSDSLLSALPERYSPLSIEIPPRAQQDKIVSLQLSPSAVLDKNVHVLTENMRLSYIKDLNLRLRSDQIGSNCLPAASSLQKFFATYVETFHGHFPFVHLPTLNLSEIPGPLILAICAIGALHRLERKVATKLYAVAQRALADSNVGLHNLDGTQFDGSEPLQDWTRPGDSGTIQAEPLALSQARLILTFFEVFSGEVRLAKQGLNACGYLGTEFRSRMLSVKPGLEAPACTWQAWADRESVKRFLCGCVILSNLLVMTYGMPPGFAMLEESDFEIPDDEALWQAETEEIWAMRRIQRTQSPTTSLREAVSLFFDEKSNERQPEDCSTWSSFSISTVMHGVAIAIWFLTQGRQACSSIAQHGEPSELETKKVQAALARCTDLLSKAGKGSSSAFSHNDGVLLFNAFAVLRVAYGRAFMNVRCLDRSLLLQQSSWCILVSLRRYRDAIQGRDEFFTLAVARALEGFAIPIKAGILLVRKSVALRWSVEHALAAWDAGLLVTKWLHTVERAKKAGDFLSINEEEVLGSVMQILAEIDIDLNRVTSLAAELARVWAGLYDDTWVWGVAPRIGWVLRELARMYEEDSTS